MVLGVGQKTLSDDICTDSFVSFHFISFNSMNYFGYITWPCTAQSPNRITLKSIPSKSNQTFINFIDNFYRCLFKNLGEFHQSYLIYRKTMTLLSYSILKTRVKIAFRFARKRVPPMFSLTQFFFLFYTFG